MGQCRGGHLKTRTDPTFTTIFYRLIFSSRIRACAEGAPFVPLAIAGIERSRWRSKGDRDNLKRNGTEKRDPLRSNVARRLPNTVLGNAHSRIYPSHLLLPAGWGLLHSRFQSRSTAIRRFRFPSRSSVLVVVVVVDVDRSYC